MDDIIKRHNQEVVEDEFLYAGALKESTPKSLEVLYVPKLTATSETEKALCKVKS
ncbi:MAG: hypothetical protein OEY95_03535 [Candidatus Bathyarchaeota archaeon]|nr:hypothetical protein [Candidatus Bathyarchaeota archaeon]MDH5754264.1 hypothetical protein [Candidatus Bathyarchaeota archaeon]